MGNDSSSASEAARISSGLMQSSADVGMPAIRGVTDYATRGLNQGLPSYVERGYTAAGTAALEQSLTDSENGRVAIPQGAGGQQVGALASAYAGSAGNLARNRAGINLSRAGATISQRNQLVKTLLGQGADSVNLASGFGALTNRGLAAGLGRGDPTYEAITGGGAVATTLLTKLLANSRTGGADYSSPLGAAYSLSQIPVG